jgi:hypothetical protein
MIIKVKCPGDCPLRVFVGGKFACFAKHNAEDSCNDAVNFPKDCPLHSRTVIIEKEGVEAESEEQAQQVQHL